jgi:hypothetical protein
MSHILEKLLQVEEKLLQKGEGVYFCILHCTNCHYFDLYAKINN